VWGCFSKNRLSPSRVYRRPTSPDCASAAAIYPPKRLAELENSLAQVKLDPAENVLVLGLPGNNVVVSATVSGNRAATRKPVE
jgi:hypothetical protein